MVKTIFVGTFIKKKPCKRSFMETYIERSSIGEVLKGLSFKALVGGLFKGVLFEDEL